MTASTPSLGRRALHRVAHAMRPADEWLGRRVFGNANRFSVNLRGASHVWRARRDATPRQRLAKDDATEALRREGCLLLRDLSEYAYGW